MNELKKFGSAAASNTGLLLFLAACPAMGASADLRSALVMGLCVLVMGVITAACIGALRSLLSGDAVIAAAVLITAGLAGIVNMLLRAYMPVIYTGIWMYVAACAMNLMLISQCELGMGKAVRAGVIFLAAVAVTAAVRELFGMASIAGVSVAALENYKISILTKAPGGFMIFALVMAVFSGLGAEKKKGE